MLPRQFWSSLPVQPMPILKRAMAFVDGENLVFRYQQMLKDGYVPQAGIEHSPDEYVWTNRVTLPGDPIVTRAYYYASAVGDSRKIAQVEDTIKAFVVRVVIPGYTHLPHTQLSPVVFKKENRGNKAKGIDIRMTVDILTHTFQDNLDSLFLFSGDGDYVPILQEVIRMGKRVFVGAFSTGLNRDLRKLADDFIDLDSIFIDMNQLPAPKVSPSKKGSLIRPRLAWWYRKTRCRCCQHGTGKRHTL
jgi:uncharacterized LabA/DUF88 family protein